MKLQEMPDRELIDLYTAAWESVNNDCFSSSDVLVELLGHKELMRRGYTINETSELEIEREGNDEAAD